MQNYESITLKEELHIRKIYSIHYFEYMKDYVFDGESHDFWEFVFVDSGNLFVTAGDQEVLLASNEMIFHKPNEFHALRGDGEEGFPLRREAGRGGAGGEESALFSAVLFRMYSMYAEKKGYKVEIVNANETELGGYKEISFMIEGEGAYSRFKYESGVHRVQRVPETESQGRVHTSTTTVAVLPEAEDVELEIDPKDLKIDTFRSSGAGGQHINKTSSAIRITHLPTGTVVECQDERSQYKNKDKALKVLKSRLLKEKQDKQASEIAANRKSQVGTGDRSERIRTYNYPQGRLTDHRIGLTLYKLEDILNGNLDEVIDALVTADRAEKLKESMENS